MLLKAAKALWSCSVGCEFIVACYSDSFTHQRNLIQFEKISLVPKEKTHTSEFGDFGNGLNQVLLYEKIILHLKPNKPLTETLSYLKNALLQCRDRVA